MERAARCDGMAAGGFWPAADYCLRGAAGGRRAPDCQSRRSCSRRSKMRANMAAIRAWMALGSKAHFAPDELGVEGLAIGAPREGPYDIGEDIN